MMANVCLIDGYKNRSLDLQNKYKLKALKLPFLSKSSELLIVSREADK